MTTRKIPLHQEQPQYLSTLPTSAITLPCISDLPLSIIFSFLAPKKKEFPSLLFFALCSVCYEWNRVFRQWVRQWMRKSMAFYFREQDLLALSSDALSCIGSLWIHGHTEEVDNQIPGNMKSLTTLHIHKRYWTNWSIASTITTLCLKHVCLIQNESKTQWTSPPFPPALTSLKWGDTNIFTSEMSVQWKEYSFIDFRSFTNLTKLKLEWDSLPKQVHLPPNLTNLSIRSIESPMIFDNDIINHFIRLIKLQCASPCLSSLFRCSFSFPNLKTLSLWVSRPISDQLSYFPANKLPCLSHLRLYWCHSLDWLRLDLSILTHLTIGYKTLAHLVLNCKCPALQELSFVSCSSLRFDFRVVLPCLSKIRLLDGTCVGYVNLEDWRTAMPVLDSVECQEKSGLYLAKETSVLPFKMILDEESKLLEQTRIFYVDNLPLQMYLAS
jgi:hypothetical protein